MPFQGGRSDEESKRDKPWSSVLKGKREKGNSERGTCVREPLHNHERKTPRNCEGRELSRDSFIRGGISKGKRGVETKKRLKKGDSPSSS